MSKELRLTVEEERHLRDLKDFSMGKYGTVIVPTDLYLKMVEALEHPVEKTIGRIYGQCHYCKVPTAQDCNVCSSCADERGP